MSSKLQSQRLHAGLSQSQLATAADCSVRVIQSYENSARDINGAKLLTLLKLCQVLNCHLSDILDDPETIEAIDKYKNL